MKELERAIEKLDKFISTLPISVGWNILDPLCECAELLKEIRTKLCREDLKIAIGIEENKPLESSELIKRTGKIVWDDDEKCYVLIYAIKQRYSGANVTEYVEYILPTRKVRRCKLEDCVFYAYPLVVRCSNCGYRILEEDQAVKCPNCQRIIEEQHVI